MRGLLTIVIILTTSIPSFGDLGRSWQQDEQVSNSQLNFEQEAIDRGLSHTLNYPVDTGLHFPYKPFFNLFNKESKNPIKKIIKKLIYKITGNKSLMDVQDQLGLVPYPLTPTELEPQPYYIPASHSYQPHIQKMGFTVKDLNNTQAFTISCAQCHTSNLFGKAVIGLSNRFPRPNEFFVQTKKIFNKIPLQTFKLGTKFNKEEFKLLKKAKKQLNFVGAKIPTQLGLDTSLAQVALSLAQRNIDGWASLPHTPYNNKSHPLNHTIADSKPMVWWNAKYKNKWLADGSVISGNPILTNILWNEVGRGADLKELDVWAQKNKNIINELTQAVFSSQPPQLIDYIDEMYFSDLERLKQGQKVYRFNCAKCHGIHIKGWNENEQQSLRKLITTQKLFYSEHTDAIDVGTDPLRYQAMKHLLPLNNLDFSNLNNIKIQTKKGYVPPPLDGIWARYPYMHNNSIPSLCELLKPSSQRTKAYMARAAKDINKDFDLECNGYPISPLILNSDKHYDSSRPGLSNSGHDLGILIDQQGNSLLSEKEIKNLIYFLQTL